MNVTINTANTAVVKAIKSWLVVSVNPVVEPEVEPEVDVEVVVDAISEL